MDPNVLDEVREGVRGFGYNEYLRHLQPVKDAAAHRTPLRVAILRSYTLEPIEPVLQLRLLLDGFEPEFWIGGYNQYHQEVLDRGSGLYGFRPDLVLMMIRLEEVSPDFVEDYPSRTVAEWQAHLARSAEEIGRLAQTAAADLSAQVIVQNMSLGRGAYFGIFDPQRQDGQAQLVHEFNRALASAASAPGVFVWDFDGFVHAEGFEHLYDPKMWYVSRNPFKQSAYPALVADLLRYVRSALGRTKKCVVLDLDNTLWGGVAGEDGFEGIKLGDTYPGNCFKDFQRQLLRLYNRGILLAINSKNNEADAFRILDDHPDMVLRRRHFAAMRINWRDKATNLRELAAELNIGLDSFLFVDDNPAECELVRQQCPECDVVQVPSQPYLIPRIVFDFPEVENIHLTEEDRKKGEMYLAQAARKVHEEQFASSDLEGFLRSLELKVAIEPATPFSIPRVAQLTQKTNQMNMTTRRYTEARIQSFAGDPAYGVYAVSAKDRFGDHGIIGVLILQHEGDSCLIDTFLLSCRVIGRGIEDTMVQFALEEARERGVGKLVGEFIPTPKNAPAAGFFERAGFAKEGETRYLMTTETGSGAADSGVQRSEASP